MKSIPPSQVSFGRGVGQEGRSSGVKDKRIGRPVWVHCTVTQYLHFLSLVFPSTAVGLNHQDLRTWLSSAWGPYWQDNFGILHSLPMDTKIPSVCENIWSIQVNPADPLLYWVKEFIHLVHFSSHFHYGFLMTSPSGFHSWTGKPGNEFDLKPNFPPFCVSAPPLNHFSLGWWGWEMGQFLHSTAWMIILIYTLFPWHSKSYFLQNGEKDIFLKFHGCVSEWIIHLHII